MSLLWKTAMAWHEDPSPLEGKPIDVRDAGFAGYTQTSFDIEHGPEEDPHHHPDHQSTELGHFIEDGQPNDWKRHATLGQVDISGPVYATQPHVHPGHMDRHDSGQVKEHHGFGGPDPMFVTHQGRLHVVEGHHRTALALGRGDRSIKGWHYDLDRHPFKCSDDCEYF